ncbi:hypothetical protein H4R18_002358 [Coemansia javaensis]|uniref:Calcineurin-like phosphoesterase domain-containing protein n=1 Tax=Coemansia javaensis TaxID=2761396 RepID=A0A9W8HGX5_9FUNG|nr:hypothetical protein H4R18_002358 [Coemansia javaensis]
MHRARLANSLGLALATLACWLYALHLDRAARQPLGRLAADGASPADGLGPADRPGPADMGDSPDRVLTFVHASDLHISRHAPTGGFVHFLHFVRTAVPLIAPRLVAITGDLTDGKGARPYESAQQPDEWAAYQRTIAPLRARFNGTFLRDQRGNHDCFDVPAADAPQNLFRTHSATGDSSGYLLRIEEPFGAYSFVAADACPARGIVRPLNFFGYLDAPRLRALEQRMAAARGSNHTFVLSHYPSSAMGGLPAALARQATALLSGHLHRLAAGLGARLQAYRPRDGLWELEIADMKQHAAYRVFAVDHDVVAFADVALPLPAVPLPNPGRLAARIDRALPHPPVVLVTNPKDARYLMPRHEPLPAMRASRFIRVLVWADRPLARVDIYIDGRRHPHPAVYRGTEPAAAADGNATKVPLWVAPWDPAQYDDGAPHDLTITAVDVDGKTTTSRTPFHLAARAPLPLHNSASGGWIMRRNFAAVFRASAIAIYLLTAALLVVAPRVRYALLPGSLASWLADRAAAHRRDRAHIACLWDEVAAVRSGASIWARPVLPLALCAARLAVCAQVTRQVYWASIPWLFWPAYLLAMALAVLPLTVGQLIPSAGARGIAAIYACGVYVAGDWVPTADSWAYALNSLVPLLVLVLYLPLAVTPPALLGDAAQCPPWLRSVWARLLVLAYIVLSLGVPVAVSAIAYGWRSVALGFGKAWLLAAACAALYVVDWHRPAPAADACPVGAGPPA